jgi:general secretion pathway protein E
MPAAADTAFDPTLASDRFLARVPLDFARERLVLSQGIDADGAELLRCADADPLVMHNLSARLEAPLTVELAPAEGLARALDDLAAKQAERAEPGAAVEDDVAFDDEDLAEVLEGDERDLLKTAGRAPVVKLVNALLFEALGKRASDVHVQPVPDGLAVRYRVDGDLHEARRLPARLLAPVISRIKVMAKMDIAERRLPQDGRAVVSIGGQEVDLRVSTLPTALGERAVVRLLDKRNAERFHLEALGMPGREQDAFEAICRRPHGMVLVTGPTGSGKTTTLYAALSALASPDRNVMTLEDPIEYELAGVSQSQINTKKGVTFATGLRHILRQDPDVIMVGEIRDAETARIAIQSALTGHMVFSTLHTNSAAAAVVRLVDLGVEPYLVNASLSAALAQRLVRTVCPDCKGGSSDCARCTGTGLSGRTGIYELLVMDEEVRRLVARGAPESELQACARARGMRTLRESALLAVEAGVTTRDEADRVTLLEDVA